MSLKPKSPTHRALAERWPHLFMVPCPLKIGITQDYYAIPNRPVSGRRWRHFLWWWCRQPEYLEALAKSRHRYDLNGNICPKFSERKP